MAEYRINFKKYREHCLQNSIQIPHWFTHIIFKSVLEFMKKGEKLQACKFLTTLSKDNKTRRDPENPGYTGYDFGLRWSKTEVADVIESFKIHESVVHIKPEFPKNIITTDEVREVLDPFVRIANNEFGSINLNLNGKCGFDYEVTVTVKATDLNRILVLINKMNEPISWEK